MPQPDLLCQSTVDAALRELIGDIPLPGLVTSAGRPHIISQIEAAIERHALAGTSSAAGLWLLAGELDRSHAISQELPDGNGSYWHGIMHRTEGDYWNAKYWMRRTSRHPVRALLVQQIQNCPSPLIQSTDPALSELASPIRQLLNSPETVAESLIDLVERAMTKQTEWVQSLQVICWWEWQLLFQNSLDC